MFRWLIFIVLIVLICIHEISSDNPQVENDLQSKLSERPLNPTHVTLSKDSSSLKFSAQTENANNKEIEAFYQKISQQLQSHEENPASTIVRSASQSSVQSKSAASEMKNTAKAAENKKYRATNHFRPHSRVPATRYMPRISYTAKPGDRTFTQVLPHHRFRRDTLLEKRLPRHKGGLRKKTDDDKGSFHFRLILGKNSTARSLNPKLKKLKHPVNLHVLRKRAAIMDEESAEMKQKHLDREKIYLEHNEISDDFDSFAKEKMWSSELAKDKLNFFEKKFANDSQGKFDGRGLIANDIEGERKGNEINENILQNGINFGSNNSTKNVDQSSKEKCGNPQIFSYRYYWCRAKNVFRNFIKLFKSK